jgi:type II secretory pathway predicted ATPase ExeA
MNHLAFFNLSDDPFRITPDQDFFFPSANHTALAEVVRYGLNQGEGFIIITGEVGTGKTLLLRLLMKEMTSGFETALILSPHLSPKEMLLAILQDIGIDKTADSRASMDHLLRVLNDHIFILSKNNKRLVIIIDEAQNLPEESIEQLRLLSNFESDKMKLLQIVLVGQPELHEKIHQPRLRQLLQRVTIKETLPPLSKDETREYVHFRLAKAGRDDMQLTGRACNLLWRITKGVPRLINKLMGRALLVAYAGQKQAFDHRVLKEAASSLDLGPKSNPALRARIPWLLTAGLTLVVLAWIIANRPDLDFIRGL